MKRVLLLFEIGNLGEKDLELIRDSTYAYNELIFIIDKPDEADKISQDFCKNSMRDISKLLFDFFKDKPFYLLPIPSKGLTEAYYWLRVKILSPSFSHVFTDKETLKPLLSKLYNMPVYDFKLAGAGFKNHAAHPEPLHENKKLKRVLFISRAQPYHLGHEAFVKQIREEADELIFLIALANQSHTFQNPATASERLEMIKPRLEELMPGRHYLLALPYSDFSMENFLELSFLLPSFDTLYTSNPATAVLAKTAGYKTCDLRIPNQTSGTLIREQILKGQSYQEYVPASVYAYLEQSAIPQRLRELQSERER